MKRKELKESKKYYHDYDSDPRKAILIKNRKRKKIKRNRRIAFIILLSLIILFFTTNISKVKTVTVKNNKIVNSEFIKKMSTISSRDYYFMVNKSKIKSLLEKQAFIHKATISISLFGDYTISIEESDLMAYAIFNKKTYVIDKDGKFALYDKRYHLNNIQGFPRLTQFKNLSLIEQFAKAFVKVPYVIKNATSDVIWMNKKSDPTRVRLVMDNGKNIEIRIEDMAERLQEKNFDYAAYMTEFSDYTTFSFEGRYMYVSKNKK